MRVKDFSLWKRKFILFNYKRKRNITPLNLLKNCVTYIIIREYNVIEKNKLYSLATIRCNFYKFLH